MGNIAGLTKAAVEIVNTPFSDEGSAKYNTYLRVLVEAVSPPGTPADWDEVYEGDQIIGFDIGDIRITVRETP